MAFNFKKLLKTIGSALFDNLKSQTQDQAGAIIDRAKDDLTAKATTEIAKGAEALKAKLDRKSS